MPDDPRGSFMYHSCVGLRRGLLSPTKCDDVRGFIYFMTIRLSQTFNLFTRRDQSSFSNLRTLICNFEIFRLPTFI